MQLCVSDMLTSCNFTATCHAQNSIRTFVTANLMPMTTLQTCHSIAGTSSSCQHGAHSGLHLHARPGSIICGHRTIRRRCKHHGIRAAATRQTTAAQPRPLRPLCPLRIKEQRGGGEITYECSPSGSLTKQQTTDPPSRSAGGAISSLFLPAGYPDSVTPDYLQYQAWSVPTHIFGWLSSSLTTSTLFKAVGINTTPEGATAAAAAIKWITKDGIGAFGRFIVGGKLGKEFDDDPRRWRMAAEIFTTLGLALEISTVVAPSYFFLLAGAGNFSKAVGKGIGHPVFRVIQTHFAASGNVGAVAAKEEVWEVAAQLTGYAASIVMLRALEGTHSSAEVVGLWAACQAIHVGLRYVALSQLSFASLSRKRASLVVAAHLEGRALPNVADCNAAEPILTAPESLPPNVLFGVTLEEAWGGELPPDAGQRLGEWLAMYQEEQYLLSKRGDVALVVLKDVHRSEALLRAMWQAAWLERAAQRSRAGNGASGHGHDEVPSELLASSLEALHAEYPGFVQELQVAGWDVSSVTIRTGPVRVQLAEHAGL